MKIILMIIILMGSFYGAEHIGGSMGLCIMYLAGIINSTIQGS